MMNDAYALWNDFEKESGTTVYRRTGILVFGPSENGAMVSIADSLARGKVPYEVFSGREANLRYPHQLKIPDTYTCVYEDGGGSLNAQKSVMAFQQQFQKLGGTLLDNHEVVQIIPGGAVVTVVTRRGTFRTRNLVIAAGAWTQALCSTIGLHLPFKVVRSELNYWKVDNAAVFTPDKFPVVIGYFSHNREDMHFYELPIDEYPGLLKQQFQKLGGTLLDNHEVVQIIPGGAVVTVVTRRGTFRTRNLVIAAGAWTQALCSTIGLHLPFKVVRSELNYWKVDNAAVFTPDKFPVVIGYFSHNREDMHFYELPIDEYPGLLKVCAHGGEVIQGPDGRDSIGGPATVPAVGRFISSTLRGVATQPSITEYCMYTMSPDKDPVIDRHPLYSNIIIAAGFSGHGFKLSPIVGSLVAELVTGQKLSHDLHPFRVARFQTPQSSL
jgi:glycine/D-amino acid oxidase-like deaminating enzyme